MCSDMTLINEREGRPKKLDKVNQGGALVDRSFGEFIQKCVNVCQCQVLTKVISLGKEVMCVSQGIYIQQDQVKLNDICICHFVFSLMCQTPKF